MGAFGMFKAAFRRLAGRSAHEGVQACRGSTEAGATSIEYVFIASLISLVVFLVVFQIGDWVVNQFGRMVNAL